MVFFLYFLDLFLYSISNWHFLGITLKHMLMSCYIFMWFYFFSLLKTFYQWNRIEHQKKRFDLNCMFKYILVVLIPPCISMSHVIPISLLITSLYNLIKEIVRCFKMIEFSFNLCYLYDIYSLQYKRVWDASSFWESFE